MSGLQERIRELEQQVNMVDNLAESTLLDNLEDEVAKLSAKVVQSEKQVEDYSYMKRLTKTYSCCSPPNLLLPAGCLFVSYIEYLNCFSIFFRYGKNYLCRQSRCLSVRPSVRPSSVEITLGRRSDRSAEPIDLKIGINMGNWVVHV